MRVAFVNFEYSADTSHGRNATYVWHHAKMLALRGHHVEVFAGSEHRQGSTVEEGVVVHRLLSNRETFAKIVAQPFSNQHATEKFGTHPLMWAVKKEKLRPQE